MTKLAGSRAEAASLKNVAFEVCDMQVEKPSGGPFDAATSQFGVMFFENPVAAFTNIRKNLKRGGRLVFGCWQQGARNSWCVLPILVPFMANPPQPSNGAPSPGPFALGDAKYTRDILERAGFAQVTRTPKTIITRVPPDAVVDRSVANAWGVPPERHEAAFAAIDEYMAQFAQPDGRLRMELKVQIFSAINA
jgi:SAM-dependent methyltransferase